MCFNRNFCHCQQQIALNLNNVNLNKGMSYKLKNIVFPQVFTSLLLERTRKCSLKFILEVLKCYSFITDTVVKATTEFKTTCLGNY